MKTIVIASGYFNPLHKGHIEYLEKAKKLTWLYDGLVVIVNNDEQVRIKKSVPFQDFAERMKIVGSLSGIGRVIPSIDYDDTVCRTIESIVNAYQFLEGKNVEFVFAKGGDRNSKNIPEAKICKKLGVKIVDGLGSKIQSSSELLEKVESKRFVQLKVKFKK
jgi:cytidyltransferase-like protein